MPEQHYFTEVRLETPLQRKPLFSSAAFKDKPEHH
jgi:hypothetical protein